MIPRTNYLPLVGLLLAVLAVTGCAAVTPTDQPSPTAIVESSTDFEQMPAESSEPPVTSTIPPEDVSTPVATTTNLPDPTAAPTLPPTATPTALPTETPTTQPRAKVVANDYGEAPEINTEVWLNTDQPLRLEELRGKVVLVDFWTYG